VKCTKSVGHKRLGHSCVDCADDIFNIMALGLKLMKIE